MTHALVIGGGIAGTVAAIALQKAGFEPTIYEAFDRTADGIGNFVNIAPNGLDALDSVGLGDLVRRDGFDTPAIAFYSHTGRALTGDVRTDRISAEGMIIQTIRRSALYIALRDEAVRRGIRVEYGKRVTDAKTAGGGVRAVFADGDHAEGDLLVGADGLRSRVRRIIDPAAPAPRYLGVLNAFGCARGVRTPGPSGVIRMFFGRESFFSYTKHPNGDLWWFANPPRPAEPDPAELSRAAETWREDLPRLFEKDRTPAAEIIRATTDLAPPSPTYDLHHVPRWHRDRMVVIGDAAHAVSPTAGQGCSVAMEDGVVLAKCLRDSGSVDGAFATYEAARRQRVEDIVAQGKYNNEGNMRRGAVGRQVRNFFISRAFRTTSGRSDPTWMLGHHIDWDAPEPAASHPRGLRTTS
ncbi:FAD-dependent oxidoreductase [Streptomyces liangshanensis]|uniref:NAD(P)-binding protein n=1 Tax=Streptomyces liangshanensis TaxID=2717324 RepID=A0A6G9GUI1_9ACTN|nr:FAD-dependent monooxygenase [Streptomyces liangshanensis]QIQ01860.1 NAD(P)-binding protein [Streptomyces liangshanensis]